MGNIWSICKCGYGLVIDMICEGTYICPRCNRKYRRWYNSKTQMYEFYEVSK